MNFITVEEAERIVLSHTKDFGVEEMSFDQSLGRVLAEGLFADRDLPPFNRPTVDGVAIKFDAFQNGIRCFKIKATQAAGVNPVAINNENECVEIMTGAVLHETVDTVIRYEDIEINEGLATINISSIKKGQNIHPRGKDKMQGDKINDSGRIIDPALIGLATSVGKTKLLVKKIPQAVIITTGDEMVNADFIPTPYQLRRSNDHTIKAALQQYTIQADTQHLNDNYSLIKNKLNRCLQQYDVILMSGGVSMGKFDYVPKALEDLSVEKLFHKVKQRPGKPFWFGKHENDALVFAFPGNPVSAFMCLHRYFFPWLETSLGIHSPQFEYAVLNKDVTFNVALQYFMQVRLSVNDKGQVLGTPVEGHGSGDLVNLLYADAFMELPLERNEFKRGEVYRIWKY